MGDLGELLIAAIMLIFLGYYKLPGVRAWVRSQFAVTIPDHSVKTFTPDPIRSESVQSPQSNAVDCLTDCPQTGLEPASSLTSEPEWIEITREDLIESLALVLVLEPDGSRRKLSQDTIRAAAGMGKETVAAMMRQARHEPEPEPKQPGPQFKQVEGKQQFVRTNAKPVR